MDSLAGLSSTSASEQGGGGICLQDLVAQQNSSSDNLLHLHQIHHQVSAFTRSYGLFTAHFALPNVTISNWAWAICVLFKPCVSVVEFALSSAVHVFF